MTAARIGYRNNQQETIAQLSNEIGQLKQENEKLKKEIQELKAVGQIPKTL